MAKRTVVGQGIARLIRNLLTKIGLKIEALVKIIKTVLIPVLVYRSKVQQKGRENNNKEIKAQRQTALVKELEGPLKAYKRFALSADKSVLLKVLNQETGIPKIEDILKNTRDRASLRLNRVTTDHLTIWRKAKASKIYKLRTYVSKDIEALQVQKAKSSPI